MWRKRRLWVIMLGVGRVRGYWRCASRCPSSTEITVSRRRSLKTFVSLASAAAVLAVPSGATAQERTVETATNGNVTAELSYRETVDFRVKITRDGAVLYDRAIGGRCEEFCMPTESALTGKHVGFRDLDGVGEPEVIVDVHSGGTSCCVLVFAF